MRADRTAEDPIAPQQKRDQERRVLKLAERKLHKGLTPKLRALDVKARRALLRSASAG